MTSPDYEPIEPTAIKQVKFAICKLIQEDQLYKSLSYANQAALMDFHDFDDKIVVGISWELPRLRNISLRIEINYEAIVSTHVYWHDTELTPVAAHALLQLYQQVVNLGCKIEAIYGSTNVLSR